MHEQNETTGIEIETGITAGPDIHNDPPAG
jgi:hypothetical protein